MKFSKRKEDNYKISNALVRQKTETIFVIRVLYAVNLNFLLLP